MYVSYNKGMQDFHNEIARLTNTTISKTSAENYTAQLNFLGIKTLNQLQETLSENKDLALKIAAATIKDKGVEELSLDIGIRLLCFAKAINDDLPVEQIAKLSNISLANEKLAEQQAQRLLYLKKTLLGK